MANLTGSTTAVFFVRLSTAVDEIVDVDWNTRDGTAIAGKDYEAASGTVSFLPGETEKAIDVVVYGQDDVSANGKKFYIELKPPVNAVLTDALAECVITVADEDGVLVTSLVIAQGKRGLKGNPGLSAYEQAVLMGYEGTVEDWMNEIGNAADAAARAEAAAVAANIGGMVYSTPEAGVNPNTGVPVGDYFNVRSPSSDAYVDEYQNIGGVAVSTGKSYPTAKRIDDASASAEIDANRAEIAAEIATLSGKVYETPGAGVDPVTGVTDGAYFNVRSTSNDNFIDEYCNIGGVATPTGKSYPTSSFVQGLAEYVPLPYKNGATYDLHERVTLANGDVVRSTIANNTNNPNVDMTGWVNEYDVLDQKSNYPNYGIVPPEPLNDYAERMPIQAILKTDGTDETATLRAYLLAAKTLNRELYLPSGKITVTDTITIDYTAVIRGYCKDKTLIQMKSDTYKPLFKLVRGSTKTVISDLSMRDENFNTTIGIQMTDSRTDVGNPVWKNTFRNIELLGFKVGVHFTSANVLDGTTHAHCDGNLFEHVRFVQNETSVLLQNCQAVDNNFIDCNINNYDVTWLDGLTKVDNNFIMFRDEAGGHVNIFGGDLIGRGKLFEWHYPVGGTGLFSGSGTFNCTGARMELRQTHGGVLINESTNGVTSTSRHMAISVTDLRTVNFGATIDLIRFSGQCKVVFNNCATVAGTGKLIVRNYPTLGRTSNTTVGTQTDVKLINCGNVFYEKETSSPYGTYSLEANPSVESLGAHSSSTNASYTTDAQGFRVLQHGGDIQQLGQGFNQAFPYGKLTFNNENPSSGFAANGELKFRLPKYGRPLKMFMYKMAVRFSNEVGVELYIVKDNANWADPSSFSRATDATLVATSELTANKAGYFEYPIQLISNIVGISYRSGFDNWTEGRMLFVIKSGANYSGFFGIDYV